MKHSACPHCGAHISLRQRWLPKKGAIRCAHCGEVSYLALGAFWLPDHMVVFCLALLIQHGYHLPWWIAVVAAIVTFAVLMVVSPLQTREISKWARGRQLLAGLVLVAGFSFLAVWARFPS